MFKRLVGGALGAAVLFSSIGMAQVFAAPDSSGMGLSSLGRSVEPTLQAKVFRDANGNYVETVMPGQSTYIPDIAGANRWSVARATKLLAGVNHFCATHNAAYIQAHWRPGDAKTAHQTHWFNPNGESGLHPARPRAALIYDGKLGGVAFTGHPLPRMGSIPRAHIHDMNMGTTDSEMVHVYCTHNLNTAYTPNRVLGVKALMIELRLKIRPAVTDLNRSQLRHIRTMVRNFCGAKLQPVAPIFPRQPGGPKPILQAMRTEIRNSLMIMTQHQLHVVWSRIQKYGA